MPAVAVPAPADEVPAVSALAALVLVVVAPAVPAWVVVVLSLNGAGEDVGKITK